MRRSLGAAGVLAAAFLLLHLPFFPQSLEDLDSLNFALGVRDFEISLHQPHPPGYPVYIVAAKAVNFLIADELRALSLLGVICGAMGALALAAVYRRLDHESGAIQPVMAAALALTAPLYWFSASRPLSDVPGLAAALGVQALTLAATTGNRLAVAAFMAGLATGIRSQVVWLTVPLLALVAIRRPRAYRLEDSLVSLGALIGGGLAWFVPMVWVTGGPAAYWRVLVNQGTEDFTGVGMLWTTHTPQQVLLVLSSTFIAPWGLPLLSGVVLALALVGACRLLLRKRPTALLLAVAFGPYLLFDLVFQEGVTTRYALPVVVPLAYLAVVGASAIRPAVAPVLIGSLAAGGLFLGVLNLQAFASEPAPAFRLLNDMRANVPRLGAPPVLAMHRREELDMRRPIEWMLSDLPSWSTRLPATPKHEWFEVVKFFNTGARAPLWFIADPLRSDIALIDHDGPKGRYRWALPQPILLSGVRPDEMDWYVFDRPGWYLGEGWALTPETAGIADTGSRGRGRGPSEGWLLRREEPVTLMIGGRNFAGDGSPAAIDISIDGRSLGAFNVPPGFFLRMMPVNLAGASEYAPLSVATKGDVALEQFDARPPARVVFGYGDGWHEREYDPETGRLWRWMSERAELRLRGNGQPLSVQIQGATENFSGPSTVTIRIGDRVLSQQPAGTAFSIRASIPRELVTSGEQIVTVETDQVYVPAEHDSATADRRHLGLKVFDVSVR